MVMVDVDRTGRVPVPDVDGCGPGWPSDGNRVSVRRHPPTEAVPRPGRWHPLSGDDLLARLRTTGRRRPPANEQLALRLRACLEQGLAGGPDPAGTAQGPTLVVTKDRLARVLSCQAHQEPTGFGDRAPTSAMACGALVDVLFRQLVTTGSIGEPMADALAALSVDDRQRSMVEWIGQLPATERGELATEVGRQADGLQRRWPPLDPVWLPRTQQGLRAPLCGGAVELSARVDLAIGRPAVDEASVAIIEVKSGVRRAQHRSDLHFYALIETMRSSAPPFVVATYYTRTGELDVEPVTEGLLSTAARRTLIGVRSLQNGTAPAHPGAGLCCRCLDGEGGAVMPEWHSSVDPRLSGAGESP